MVRLNSASLNGVGLNALGEKPIGASGGAAPSYPNGVYVQHIDKKLYTEEEWTAAGFGNNVANGVAVITDNARFVIAKNSIGLRAWSSNTSAAIDGIMLTSNSAAALTDFAGYNNTQLMLATDTSGAGFLCANYTFPNGDKGYLPALGELYEAYVNKAKIDSLMSLIGGNALSATYYTWSSTQCGSDKAWSMFLKDSYQSQGAKTATNWVRAFTRL